MCDIAAMMLISVLLTSGVAHADQSNNSLWDDVQLPVSKDCFPVCPQPICPTPFCSQPVCPSLPPLPPCPLPICPKPECPEPKCPQPICPKPTCPEPKCSQAACPACPDCHPAAVSCPQPVCPQPVCPEPVCPPLTVPPAQPCPAKGATCAGCLWKVLVNYDHFHGHGFYKAYKMRVNWHQAKALCEADGAHLSIINSEKEAQLLKMLYESYELSGWVFIGYHDQNSEGYFETIFGEPLSKTGYNTFSPGNPDNFFDEDCGTMDSNGKLNDGRCDWKTGFICEVSEEKALGQ